MKLHNYFEIYLGDKRVFAFNSLCAGLSQKFAGGANFTRYIVFGTGAGGAAGTLSQFLGFKETTLYAKNFDCGSGPLFIKKSITLDGEEYCGSVISEIGLSHRADGTDLTNYALTGGITKSQNQSLTVIATLYIEDFLSGISLCRGENPLMPYLFGLKSIDGGDFSFAFSDLEEEETLPRSGANLYGEKPALISFEGDSAVLSAKIPDCCNYPEILLCCGGAPAMRLTAGENRLYYQSLSLKAFYGAADTGGVCFPQAAWDSGGPLGFYAEERPVGVSSVLKNPFKFILGKNDLSACSASGGYYAVKGGESLTVYKSVCGIPQELPFYLLLADPTVAYAAALDSKGNIFLLSRDYPYIIVFKNNGGILYRSHDTASAESGIYSLKLSEYGGGLYLRIFSAGTGGETVCKTYSVEFPASVDNNVRTLVRSHSGAGMVNISSPCGEADIYYFPSDGFFITYPQGLTLHQNAREAIKGSTGGVINGNALMLFSGGKLRLFNMLTGTETPLYGSGIRKVYSSEDGKTLVRLYANNKMSGARVDSESAGLTRFELDRQITGTVTDVRILGDEAVIVSAKTKNIDNYLITLKKNTFLNLPSLRGQAEADISALLNKRDFKNEAGKRLSVKIKVTEENA